MSIHIYRGDTFSGIIQFRLTDASTGVTNPFPIPNGSTVAVHFPPEVSSSPVVLSTVNPGEITIIDADASTISYAGSETESPLLALGKNMTINCVITKPDGSIMTTAKTKILTVEDRPNP